MVLCYHIFVFDNSLSLNYNAIDMIQHSYLRYIQNDKITVMIILFQNSPAIFYVHYTTY